MALRKSTFRDPWAAPGLKGRWAWGRLPAWKEAPNSEPLTRPSLRLHIPAFTCSPTIFFFLINLFIYLFLAALGLRNCARAFSSCSEWGLLFVEVRGLLTAVASLC